jgi:hypothetical protein
MPFSHLRRWTPGGFEAAHNVAESVERFTSADTPFLDVFGLRVWRAAAMDVPERMS